MAARRTDERNGPENSRPLDAKVKSKANRSDSRSLPKKSKMQKLRTKVGKANRQSRAARERTQARSTKKFGQAISYATRAQSHTDRCKLLVFLHALEGHGVEKGALDEFRKLSRDAQCPDPTCKGFQDISDIADDASQRLSVRKVFAAVFTLFQAFSTRVRDISKDHIEVSGLFWVAYGVKQFQPGSVDVERALEMITEGTLGIKLPALEAELKQTVEASLRGMKATGAELARKADDLISRHIAAQQDNEDQDLEDFDSYYVAIAISSRNTALKRVRQLEKEMHNRGAEKGHDPVFRQVQIVLQQALVLQNLLENHGHVDDITYAFLARVPRYGESRNTLYKINIPLEQRGYMEVDEGHTDVESEGSDDEGPPKLSASKAKGGRSQDRKALDSGITNPGDGGQLGSSTNLEPLMEAQKGRGGDDAPLSNHAMTMSHVSDEVDRKGDEANKGSSEVDEALSAMNGQLEQCGMSGNIDNKTAPSLQEEVISQQSQTFKTASDPQAEHTEIDMANDIDSNGADPQDEEDTARLSPDPALLFSEQNTGIQRDEEHSVDEDVQASELYVKDKKGKKPALPDRSSTFSKSDDRTPYDEQQSSDSEHAPASDTGLQDTKGKAATPRAPISTSSHPTDKTTREAGEDSGQMEFEGGNVDEEEEDAEGEEESEYEDDDEDDVNLITDAPANVPTGGGSTMKHGIDDEEDDYYADYQNYKISACK